MSTLSGVSNPDIKLHINTNGILTSASKTDAVLIHLTTYQFFSYTNCTKTPGLWDEFLFSLLTPVRVTDPSKRAIPQNPSIVHDYV